MSEKKKKINIVLYINVPLINREKESHEAKLDLQQKNKLQWKQQLTSLEDKHGTVNIETGQTYSIGTYSRTTRSR